VTKLCAIAVAALLAVAAVPPAGATSDAGQITWAVHTTLVPTYFDPAETTIITSFMVLYALHDGVVKPMPG
jgi:peptide/nickel transport system substrate-binding protein